MISTKEDPLHLITCKTPLEFQFALDLAEKIGWNPVLNWVEDAFPLDKGGFCLGLRFDPDRRIYDPACTIFSVDLQSECGLIALYIVKEEYRKKGFGLQIFKAAMERLKSCKTICLTTIKPMDVVYHKSGFVSVETFVRKSLVIGQTSPGVVSPTQEEEKSQSIQDVTPEDFESIEEYDSKVLALDRKAFLRKWIRPTEYTKSVVARNTESKEVNGYGVLRKAGIGYKIGPLYASDIRTCVQITRKLIASIPKGEPLVFDFFTPHWDEFASLTSELPWKHEKIIEWMATNGIPSAMNLKHIFIRTNHSLVF